jgi:hypothetical protein
MIRRFMRQGHGRKMDASKALGFSVEMRPEKGELPKCRPKTSALSKYTD